MTSLSKRQMTWVGLLLTAVVVLTVTVTAVVFTALLASQIRSAQQNNTETLDNTEQTLHAVQDCTQPAGDCFKRGQKATADAVGNINRVIVLAAACAVGVDPGYSVARRQAMIQSCVIDRLAAAP